MMSVRDGLGRAIVAGIVALSALVASLPVGAQAPVAPTKPVVIFAAASLKNALDEVARDWSRISGRPLPTISYAGSNALARQIEQGAPANLFMSADTDWMDYVAGKNLIRPDTRISLLGNSIVLIGPKGAGGTAALAPGFDLAGRLGAGRLAMANVDAVPAGRYGKAALEALGLWASVREKVAQAENVRAALLLVARGEAPLGIVYATDAAAEPGVAIVGTFPADSHPPIVYPVAITRESANEDAGAFLAFLRGPGARPVFERAGFTIVNKPASGS